MYSENSQQLKTALMRALRIKQNSAVEDRKIRILNLKTLKGPLELRGTAEADDNSHIILLFYLRTLL